MLILQFSHGMSLLRLVECNFWVKYYIFYGQQIFVKVVHEYIS